MSTHPAVTRSNEVPVSVVDMDVPITAIDEVLEEFDCKITKNEAKLFTGTEPAGSNGMKISIEICINTDTESFIYILNLL